MLKRLIFVFVIIQSACLTSSPERHSGYFADATSCLQSALRKEYVKVPTAETMTVIEVPIDTDASNFSFCMRQAGHLVNDKQPDDYLEQSRYCLQQARSSSKPDEVYFACVSQK